MGDIHSANFVLKVLVVEDDFSFALDLQMLLERLGYICMGVVDNGENALELINRSAPDAILMDIDLKGQLSGLDLAENIQSLNIPVLFITSYQDPSTYNRAKEMNMVGFLVKPLNDLTLISAIDSCLKSAISQEEAIEDTLVLQDSLLIKKGKVYHKVKLAEIMHISSDLEYATIITPSDKFTFRESLKNLTTLLSPSKYFRTHKSHIINLDYLSKINTEQGIAILTNDSQVPISRRRRKDIEDHWLSYG